MKIIWATLFIATLNNSFAGANYIIRPLKSIQRAIGKGNFTGLFGVSARNLPKSKEAQMVIWNKGLEKLTREEAQLFIEAVSQKASGPSPSLIAIVEAKLQQEAMAKSDRLIENIKGKVLEIVNRDRGDEGELSFSRNNFGEGWTLLGDAPIIFSLQIGREVGEGRIVGNEMARTLHLPAKEGAVDEELVLRWYIGRSYHNGDIKWDKASPEEVVRTVRNMVRRGHYTILESAYKRMIDVRLTEKEVVKALKGEITLRPQMDRYNPERNSWSYGVLASTTPGKENIEVVVVPREQSISIIKIVNLEADLKRVVQRALEEQGLTVEELGQRAGVFPREISQWQEGRSKINPEAGEKIAKALDLDSNDTNNRANLFRGRKNTNELLRDVGRAVALSNYEYSSRVYRRAGRENFRISSLNHALKGRLHHDPSLDRFNNDHSDWEYTLLAGLDEGQVKFLVTLDDVGTLSIHNIRLNSNRTFWSIVEGRMSDRGVTLEQLARQVNLPVAEVAEWEKGREISPEIVEQVANLLGLEISTLTYHLKKDRARVEGEEVITMIAQYLEEGKYTILSDVKKALIKMNLTPGQLVSIMQSPLIHNPEKDFYSNGYWHYFIVASSPQSREDLTITIALDREEITFLRINRNNDPLALLKAEMRAGQVTVEELAERSGFSTNKVLAIMDRGSPLTVEDGKILAGVIGIDEGRIVDLIERKEAFANKKSIQRLRLDIAQAIERGEFTFTARVPPTTSREQVMHILGQSPIISGKGNTFMEDDRNWSYSVMGSEEGGEGIKIRVYFNDAGHLYIYKIDDWKNNPYLLITDKRKEMGISLTRLLEMANVETVNGVIKDNMWLDNLSEPAIINLASILEIDGGELVEIINRRRAIRFASDRKDASVIVSYVKSALSIRNYNFGMVGIKDLNRMGVQVGEIIDVLQTEDIVYRPQEDSFDYPFNRWKYTLEVGQYRLVVSFGKNDILNIIRAFPI